MNRLGTKAETLRMLYQKLKYAEVLPQYCFTSGSLQVIRQSIQKVPEIKACSIWDV